MNTPVIRTNGSSRRPKVDSKVDNPPLAGANGASLHDFCDFKRHAQLIRGDKRACRCQTCAASASAANSKAPFGPASSPSSAATIIGLAGGRYPPINCSVLLGDPLDQHRRGPRSPRRPARSARTPMSAANWRRPARSRRPPHPTRVVVGDGRARPSRALGNRDSGCQAFQAIAVERAAAGKSSSNARATRMWPASG